MGVALKFALDRASIRTTDQDGRLHVGLTPISKAVVNQYRGDEIPDYDKLGLDPNRVYNLFRDPKELEKAAATFNNLPLLSEHVPVSADEHRPDLVVGSTGTDAVFKSPYLLNSLVVWARDSINGVERDEIKELSCAYRYRADMTPGSYEGEHYDGVMRDIVGNHVAIVAEGRVKGAVIGDSKENLKMRKPLTRKGAMVHGAVAAYLRPKLAQDAKIDLSSIFANVNRANYSVSKPAIVAALNKAATGKLAADASLSDLTEFLDQFDGEDPAEDVEGAVTEPNAAVPPAKKAKPPEPEEDPVADADPIETVKAFLKGKLSDDDMKRLDDLMAAIGKAGKAHEEEEEATDADPGDIPEKKEKEGMVTKPAMDAAIAAAVAKTRADSKALRDAEKFVRPWVGELAMAQDSAECVYRTAAKMLAIPDADTIHASALPAVIKMVPKPGETKPARKPIAQDEADTSDFLTRFPHANRLSA